MANQEIREPQQQGDHFVRNGLLAFAIVVLGPKLVNHYAAEHLDKPAVQAQIEQVRTELEGDPDLYVLPGPMATAVAFDPAEGLTWTTDIEHIARLNAYTKAVQTLETEEQQARRLRFAYRLVGQPLTPIEGE